MGEGEVERGTKTSLECCTQNYQQTMESCILIFINDELNLCVVEKNATKINMDRDTGRPDQRLCRVYIIFDLIHLYRRGRYHLALLKPPFDSLSAGY